MPISGHVVVVGLGNVGSRVLEQLHDLGVPLVCVDRRADVGGAQLARRLGIAVIVGDASREETLRAASVDTCRALLAVTGDDVTNLHTGLNARVIRENLRVVLRLFDGDLAERVERDFRITISRSVSFLAAPAFAAAMVERRLIGTIAVGRQVLLVADARVGAGSELDGRALREVNELGETRVIALHRHGAEQLDWQVPAEHRLVDGDRMVIVATQSGLGHVLGRSVAPLLAD